MVPKGLKEKVESENMPVEIKSLLDEFKEIVVDDLLKGLPPMRSISRQTGLIIISRLPNKEPYRLDNPS